MGFVITAYQQAFREYGIDIDALPPERAVGLIRAKPQKIRESLAAVLDDWARRADPPADSRLRNIARDADPDPQRNAIRDAVAKGDAPALQQLARDLDVAHHPVATLNYLAWALVQVREFGEAVTLSQRSQRLYPGEFWINYFLATTLYHAGPSQYDEAIRYYTVAVALRPDSARRAQQPRRRLGGQGPDR